MSIDLNSPYSSTNNGQPAIDPQVMAEQYGWAYSFLTSVPELNTLFQQAVAQQWTPTKFQAMVQATDWFQKTSEAARNAQVAKAVDPYTYSQNVASETATVQAAANKLGAMISEQTAQTIATQQITYGWNADQVQTALAQYVNMTANGAFGGIAGQNEMALRQLAEKNGISVDDNTMKNIVQNITDNKTSVEDAAGMIRSQAAGKFPAYAEQIMNGVNLSDIAAPYQQTMQKILELGPGDTQIASPKITSALQNMNGQGVPTQMPLWQFAQNLRQDPAWKQTQNAQNSIMQTAKQVLSDFGFQ